MEFGLCKIFKSFGQLQVLSDFSLEFPVGKINCLLGASGIGKTTILNIVAGNVRPDSGKVIDYFQGNLSYLFQESLLLPWLTVKENVCYLMDDGRKTSAKEQEASELLSLMELEEFHDWYPTELSGGMARRVSLARALACSMPLMLMDEPFSGLDSDLKTRIVPVVRERICRQQRTAVLVTHDIGVAREIGHHLFFCKKGATGCLEAAETADVQAQQRGVESS